MYERHAALGVDFKRPAVSIVIHTVDQAYFGAKFTCRLDLADGCPGRHADQCGNAITPGSQSYALRVIAGRTSDDAALFFFRRKLRYFETGASYFERTCHLKIFWFQVYITKRIYLIRVYQASVSHNIGEHCGGLIDCIECQHSSNENDSLIFSYLCV